MSTRNRQSTDAKPLEELLEQEEFVLYGQTCWSLAEESAGIRTHGDIISFPYVNEEGEEVEERFRLTQESVENISLCYDLMTRGVAERFSTEEEGGEPLGPCPHGHQEAAFQFMMSGVKPEEPWS